MKTIENLSTIDNLSWDNLTLENVKFFFEKSKTNEQFGKVSLMLLEKSVSDNPGEFTLNALKGIMPHLWFLDTLEKLIKRANEFSFKKIIDFLNLHKGNARVINSAARAAFYCEGENREALIKYLKMSVMFFQSAEYTGFFNDSEEYVNINAYWAIHVLKDKDLSELSETILNTSEKFRHDTRDFLAKMANKNPKEIPFIVNVAKRINWLNAADPCCLYDKISKLNSLADFAKMERSLNEYGIEAPDIVRKINEIVGTLDIEALEFVKKYPNHTTDFQYHDIFSKEWFLVAALIAAENCSNDGCKQVRWFFSANTSKSPSPDIILDIMELLMAKNPSITKDCLSTINGEIQNNEHFKCDKLSKDAQKLIKFAVRKANEMGSALSDEYSVLLAICRCYWRTKKDKEEFEKFFDRFFSKKGYCPIFLSDSFDKKFIKGNVKKVLLIWWNKIKCHYGDGGFNFENFKFCVGGARLSKAVMFSLFFDEERTFEKLSGDWYFEKITATDEARKLEKLNAFFAQEVS